MKLPEKEYLTFAELTRKWQCSPSDLFHLIATMKVVPSLFLGGKFEMLLAKPSDGAQNELYVSALSDFESGATMQPEYVSGIFYLPWGRRGVNNSYRYFFSYASEKREIEEFSTVYSIEEPIEIEYNSESGQVYISGNVVFQREEILRFERENIAATVVDQSDMQPAYPWGRHRTNLLMHLSSAAIKFWSLYDPSDPSTAPTNDQVEKWLVEQSVPQRTAEVMATILRADGLKTGRR